MGAMFAMQCDLCDEIEVKKKAHELDGSSYTENGVQKWACAKCKAKMKAAFALKHEGLEHPLEHVAGLVDRAEKAERELDGARALLAGDHLGVARELAGADPTFGPRRLSPGQSLPVLGMGQRLERPRDLQRPALPDRSSEPKDTEKPAVEPESKESRRKKWKGSK